MLDDLKREVDKLSDSEKAKNNEWFFKTGKGQYGYGDQFAGLTVPQCKKIAHTFKDLSLGEIRELLKSKIHEERMIALQILVLMYNKASESVKENIYNLYLKSTSSINNWDLVDISAPKIMGDYLMNKDKQILIKLANSTSLWEKRIAIITTLAFIVKGESKWTFKISEILLNDKHDLIHKAIGWMLREVGKRISRDELIEFLKSNYDRMPRTTLRYAIEHFPPETRKKYLRGEFK